MGVLSTCPSVISQRLLRGLYMRFRWFDGVCLVPVFTHSFLSLALLLVGLGYMFIFRIAGVELYI